jgi:hypothetical protein
MLLTLELVILAVTVATDCSFGERFETSELQCALANLFLKYSL